MKILPMIVLGLMFALFGTGTVLADEGGHHEMGGMEMKMPDTLDGIWHEVKEHEEILGKRIQAGELAKVHEAAFEVRDYVKALVDKSTTLAAENLENVKSGAERVSEIAELLDKYGDAGDQAKTQEQFERLGKALKFIETQYPEGALQEGKGEGEGHKGIE